MLRNTKTSSKEPTKALDTAALTIDQSCHTRCLKKGEYPSVPNI